MSVDTRDQMNMGLLDPKITGLDAAEAEHRRIQVKVSGLVLGLEREGTPKDDLITSDLDAQKQLADLFDVINYGLFLDEDRNRFLVLARKPDHKKKPEESLADLQDAAGRRINGGSSPVFLRGGEIMRQIGVYRGDHVLRETKRFGLVDGHEYLGTTQAMQVVVGEMPFVPFNPPSTSK